MAQKREIRLFFNVLKNHVKNAKLKNSKMEHFILKKNEIITKIYFQKLTSYITKTKKLHSTLTILKIKQTYASWRKIFLYKKKSKSEIHIGLIKIISICHMKNFFNLSTSFNKISHIFSEKDYELISLQLDKENTMLKNRNCEFERENSKQSKNYNKIIDALYKEKEEMQFFCDDLQEENNKSKQILKEYKEILTEKTKRTDHLFIDLENNLKERETEIEFLESKIGKKEEEVNSKINYLQIFFLMC